MIGDFAVGRLPQGEQRVSTELLAQQSTLILQRPVSCAPDQIRSKQENGSPNLLRMRGNGVMPLKAPATSG